MQQTQEGKQEAKSNDHFDIKSEAYQRWYRGEGNCPECGRGGCRGTCDCPCESCQRGVDEKLEWGAIPACDVIREMRESKEDRAARKAREREASFSDRPKWGETIAQVERMGCPHRTAAGAKAANETPAIAAAKTWFGKIESKPCFVITGTVGAGKSVAAAFAAARFGQRRPWWKNQPSGGPQLRPAIWLPAAELSRLNLIRPEDEATISACLGTKLLVIDDIELEGAPAGIRAMASLLSTRLDSGRATVITGNFASAKLKAVYGDQLADRLKHFAYVFEVKGESLRGKS